VGGGHKVPRPLCHSAGNSSLSNVTSLQTDYTAQGVTSYIGHGAVTFLTTNKGGRECFGNVTKVANLGNIL